MKKIFKYVSLSLPLILGINLYGAKNEVKIASDMTGDFLMAPLYFAKGDICSNIKVMNTNEYSSILAKVTIRESIASHEVDLPILLSPGDIWSGNICQVKGKVILKSNDDSNHPSALGTLMGGIDLFKHSSITSYRENDYRKGYVELNGKSFKLEEIQKENLDFTSGYIEIYPIAQFNEHSKRKVKKSILVDRWNRLVEKDISNPKLRKYGVDNDSLSGLVSFNTEGQETASIPMIAFENVHSKQILGEAINYTSESDPSILIGKTNKTKILKLLQNSDLSFAYDNSGEDQYLHVAFPFGYKEKQSRRYKVIIRDMNENKHTMVFSPKYIMYNELACISVEELVKITNNKKKFKQGMIQITDITNNDTVQLGKDKSASLIPTISRISKIGNKDIFINIINLPAKN
ncbi:MAG: hypothetical protein U9Q33_08690 [Campylobacterota bacterium]|nr:hypothetical protein [Campylobacterota bacterium]